MKSIYNYQLKFILTVVMSVCLLTAPVTAAIDIPNQKFSPQANDTPIKNKTSEPSNGNISSNSLRLPLFQNVSITSDSDTKFVPGKSYPLLIKNSVDNRKLWKITEFWKKSSIENAKIKIKINSKNGKNPSITGISSPQTSYDHTKTEVSTDKYTLNAEELDAATVNFVMTRIKIPDTTNQFTVSVTATGDDLSSTDEKTFNVEPVDSYQSRIADLAEARADTASSLSSQYDSIFNDTSVDEIVDRGMRNTIIETAKFTKDIADLRKGGTKVVKQFAKYAKSQTTEKKFDGPWVGPIIRVQNRMYKTGFREANKNGIKNAGDSNYALQKLARYAHKEADAWENGNKARAYRLLRKQRDLLSTRDYQIDVSGPDNKENFNLYTEAEIQKSEAQKDTVLGEDISEGTIGYFTALKKFSLSKTKNINQIAIPLAEDPGPSVTLLNKPTVRDQLATGKTVTAKFSVSNNGGLTTEQGYLSLVYPNESLSVATVNKIKKRSDDSQSPQVKHTTDEKVLTKDGDRKDIDGTLTDIFETYQSGETNVYNVTLKRQNAGDGEVYISYRTAFRPVLNRNDDNTRFIRSPNNGKTGPQGWNIKNISGDAGDPVVKWNGTYSADYTSSAYEVISTEDGGYLFAGDTTGFGGDDTDVYVMKVDQDGNPEWQRQVGGRIKDHASTAVQAHDGGYIVAGYRSRVATGGNGLWMIKFDKGGDEVWRSFYGNSISDRALDIVATNDGGYAVAGYTDTVGPNPRDAWLLKITDRGIMKWNETYTSEAFSRTEAAALVQTNDGGYALAGRSYSNPRIPDAFVAKTDSGGDIEWKNTFNTSDFDDAYETNFREYATDIVQTGDGDYTFAGQWYGRSSGVVHLKSDGAVDWSKGYVELSDELTDQGAGKISSIARTSDEGYALVQRSLNGIRSALTKTDSKGNTEWRKKFEAEEDWESEGRRIARDVITTRDGGYVLAGGYKTKEASSISAWLTKTSGAAPTNNPPRLSEIRISPGNISVGETADIYIIDPRDSDGSIQSYSWDLDNDGTAERSTNTNATSYTFDTTGKFTVKVTATDNDGARTSKRRTIDVNIPPSASFKFNPTQPEMGETTTLDASYSSDTDGSIKSYNWKIENKQAKTGVSPTVTFDTAGEYNVTLTTIDNDGEKSTRNKTLTVASNTAPIAETGPNRTIFLNGGAVLSARNSSDPDGDSLSYDWEIISQPEDSSVDLDNSNLLQTFRPTETGKYHIKLSVTDKHGASSTDVLVISAVPALEAQFDYRKEQKTENTTIKFRSNSNSNTNKINSYRWDFDGDGVVETDTSNNITKYIYSQSGEYEVTLTIVSDDGSTDTTTRIIRISDDRQTDVDINDLAGSGTANDPYLISNVSELQAMEDELDSYYRLESNISGYKTSHWNNGKGFDPIGGANAAFHGKFNGAGHTISGLTIKRPQDEYDVSLFASVDDYVYKDPPGTVANVSVTNVDIIGSRSTGAIVGNSRDDATIENVFASGKVNGTDTVGGLVGDNDGRIQAVSVNISVKGNGNIGGIAGVNDGGIIANVSANGTVNGGANAGGLVGTNDPTSQLSNGVSRGSVDGTFHVGGIVGKNLATVEKTFATGHVTGDSDVGGVTGQISNDATAVYSYWDTETTGQSTSAGDAAGLTTAEMTGVAAEMNMSGLDFNSIWEAQPADYPVLALQTGDTNSSTSVPPELEGDVTGKQYAAVLADDDTLTASNLADAINGWADNGKVNGTDIGAFELSKLINYWANS